MVPPRLTVIQGATASGKSSLALSLAREFSAEIISAESRQVLADMVIGTAAPSPEERRLVPHHMVGCWQADEEVSAGRWLQAVADLLEQRPEQRFVVVGGTALWVRLLIQGAVDLDPVDPEIMAELAQLDAGQVQTELAAVDPVSAQAIHPNDRYRQERALGHFRATGEALGQRRQEHDWGRPRHGALRLALMPPRDWLHERIAQRARAMFANGLLAEAASLRRRFGEVRPLNAIGYRQALAVVDGTMAEEEAIEETARDTRRYARNQETWLRKEPVSVIETTDAEGRLAAARRLLSAWL